MRHLQKPLELIAPLFGAITFGTAYYLLLLSHPTWMAVPFEHFIPVFREMILNIGTSQIIASNIALAACVILFFWPLAIVGLLISLPVTIWQLTPINFHFLEAREPALSQGAADKLADWGNYQIIRFIGDGLAFASMCKPVLWRKKSKDQ